MRGLTEGEDEEFRFLKGGASAVLAPANDSPGLGPAVPTNPNIPKPSYLQQYMKTIREKGLIFAVKVPQGPNSLTP